MFSTIAGVRAQTAHSAENMGQRLFRWFCYVSRARFKGCKFAFPVACSFPPTPSFLWKPITNPCRELKRFWDFLMRHTCGCCQDWGNEKGAFPDLSTEFPNDTYQMELGKHPSVGGWKLWPHWHLQVYFIFSLIIRVQFTAQTLLALIFKNVFFHFSVLFILLTYIASRLQFFFPSLPHLPLLPDSPPLRKEQAPQGHQQSMAQCATMRPSTN